MIYIKTSSVYVVNISNESVHKDPTMVKPYPEIKPYDTGMLAVSDLHTIYYQQAGNPAGNPILNLHGGPGRGTTLKDQTFFDPSVYRVIITDQRGGGKSTPPGELKENTTWHLVDDIEKLRIHLQIDRWIVFGGSWGSALALAYAETHPTRVKALILRGVLTLRRCELTWLYQQGASFLFPDAWERFIQPIPEVERCDLISAYYRRLTGNNEIECKKAAAAWANWEAATCMLHVEEDYLSKINIDIEWALTFAKIECHFFVHGGFLETDDQLLKNIDLIRHIPTTIVQGRYDLQCPMETAWQVHKIFPEADLHIVPDAGHSKYETGIQEKLLTACEKYKHL